MFTCKSVHQGQHLQPTWQ